MFNRGATGATLTLTRTEMGFVAGSCACVTLTDQDTHKVVAEKITTEVIYSVALLPHEVRTVRATAFPVWRINAINQYFWLAATFREVYLLNSRLHLAKHSLHLETGENRPRAMLLRCFPTVLILKKKHYKVSRSYCRFISSLHSTTTAWK